MQSAVPNIFAILDLNQRIEVVRDESSRITVENEMLGGYIQNLIVSKSCSSIFQPNGANDSHSH